MSYSNFLCPIWVLPMLKFVLSKLLCKPLKFLCVFYLFQKDQIFWHLKTSIYNNCNIELELTQEILIHKYFHEQVKSWIWWLQIHFIRVQGYTAAQHQINIRHEFCRLVVLVFIKEQLSYFNRQKFIFMNLFSFCWKQYIHWKKKIIDVNNHSARWQFQPYILIKNQSVL